MFNTVLLIRWTCSFRWQNRGSSNFMQNINTMVTRVQQFYYWCMSKYCMKISSQSLCFEARRKCGVGFIYTQLASSSCKYSGLHHPWFTPADISAGPPTNRCSLYMLFIGSKTCMPRITFVDVPLTTQTILAQPGCFSGGHIGWNQLQLAWSVSPLCS